MPLRARSARLTYMHRARRNLGFEAEHMQRAMRGEPRTSFWRDEQAQRTGVLTTEAVKHAAMTLTNVMLRERRMCLFPIDSLVSRDPQEARRRLREQFEVYSLQFKTGETIFNKTKIALSGKVGGMKDDIIISLQLGVKICLFVFYIVLFFI